MAAAGHSGADVMGAATPVECMAAAAGPLHLHYARVVGARACKCVSVCVHACVRAASPKHLLSTSRHAAARMSHCTCVAAFCQPSSPPIIRLPRPHEHGARIAGLGAAFAGSHAGAQITRPNRAAACDGIHVLPCAFLVRSYWLPDGAYTRAGCQRRRRRTLHVRDGMCPWLFFVSHGTRWGAPFDSMAGAV